MQKDSGRRRRQGSCVGKKATMMMERPEVEEWVVVE
jgi:hypothetical protein